MEKINHKFKKSLGQNFLKDDRIVNKIVEISEIKNNSLVIEVGPGAGILTNALSLTSDRVLAYELDLDLKNRLENMFCNRNVDFLFKDFLYSDLVDDISKYDYDNLYFVSNVPYYITTPILQKLIDTGLHFEKIVMMVQKEVADRFSASSNCKEYGSITVFLNYFFDIKNELFVPREEFIPEPNVDSEVVSLTPKVNQTLVKDFDFFQKLIKDSFQFKRKNIKNNLKKYDLNIIESILKKYDLDLSCRAEQIDTNIFVEISNALS